MTKLDVITLPHHTLRKKANVVSDFSNALKKLSEDMLESMYAEKGIGLAANQVNVLERVIVVDVSEEKNNPIVFVNPEIIWASEETDEAEEGCLSLPSIYAGPVSRHTQIKVKAQEVDGAEFELEAEGLMARCIQHEIDHLEGILFIDYLSRLKQERAIKKLQKFLKEQAELKESE